MLQVNYSNVLSPYIDKIKSEQARKDILSQVSTENQKNLMKHICHQMGL